jgi:hypothetical protein
MLKKSASGFGSGLGRFQFAVGQASSNRFDNVCANIGKLLQGEQKLGELFGGRKVVAG